MLRGARTLAVLATIAASISCQTVEDPFPPQASLNVDITDSAVASQLAPLPAPQAVLWKVEELSACGLPGYACDVPKSRYRFLDSGPCTYELNALAAVPFSSFCRTSGLTLKPGPDVFAVNVRLKISRLELHAAARPDLSSSADPDGDGIPNTLDNCPIVYNPDQANVNAVTEGFKIGDACSTLDTNQQPTIADEDLDGVSDSIDNCLWYPNPLLPGESSPPDTDRDGIGDACERIAPVVLLSNGSYTIECNVTFKAESSRIAFFRMDFGRPGVLTCDAGFTGCTLDPSALELAQVGETTTFACQLAP